MTCNGVFLMNFEVSSGDETLRRMLDIILLLKQNDFGRRN